MSLSDLFGEPIESYSRAQAIEDGFLVDVSETAKEAGIKFPTAMTRTVWDQYVEVPEGVQCQDEIGRLWDIVWMLRCAIVRGSGGAVMRFEVFVRNNNVKPVLVNLKAICGPGDTPAPVITIMLPEED